MKLKEYVLIVAALIQIVFIPSIGFAQVSPLDTESGDSYYYVDHFEILINKPVADVWPHILEMSSWMPWMADTNSNSSNVSEGDLVNLYDDFYVEVVKVIPESMVLLVNLPTSQDSEGTQGVAMVTSKEVNDSQTVVSIFMSRIYYWFKDADNQLRNTRETESFVTSRRVTFKDNFLVQLKELAEN